MPPLNTHVFGPAADGPDRVPTVLALHGLTGHGRRWAGLARDHLADLRIVAPDLLGHGRSPWQPPWRIADHVAAVSDVVDAHIPEADRPFVIVGHSYGGAIAMHLAGLRPDIVRGLVLLDPAQGLDPDYALEVSTSALEHWDYDDAAEARSAKRAEGWAEVPDEVLEAEIVEHLIDRPGGRVGWRVSQPAAATSWSELSRPAVLPPAGIPTSIVVADRVQPAFVRPDFLDAIAAQRADSVEVVHADCEHMVPFLEPELSARLIRTMVGVPAGDTPTVGSRDSGGSGR
ncbi:alpha/beta hydrolase [Gordonia soli]|uniref:Putative hydrolase n=1 Tax=Gordonia soli NBRC 108243 TaxID=1223545 RepID=M0QDT2_9ACTN|nr:alpha/beta fold hydrolase [Gordonia soli]GAC66604.1 putative hydrolase [Gordonia soli NBRC 108243]